MTDEQRMEEGRRMFQIFAARMFEQRVLQAYRERVAQERQLQLLRELEEEDMAEKEREAKKAKENQKKKDKKKQAKQQKEEERMKKEEEKAAEEAAARAKLEKQREAELKKQDEIRLKREAERRQKEEEKAKKEEERRKRQEEDRLRELEKERKRKEKEDKVRMEREAKEAKEREAKAKEEEEKRAKELREKQEQDRLAKEEQEREQAKIEAERVHKEQLQQQLLAAAAALAARETVREPSSEPSASAKSTAPKSPSSSFHAGTSSPLSRKVNSNLVSSFPAQIRSTAPLAASSANSNNSAQRCANLARPGFSNQSMPSPSSLPAPPQGLPARPSTVSHAPSGSLSVLAGASSLPRPPTQAANSNSVPIGSPARQGTPSNSSVSAGMNKLGSTPLSSTNSPSAPHPQAPAGMLFQKPNLVGPTSTFHAPMQNRYPTMTFGNSASASTPTRSPPNAISMAANGFMPSNKNNTNNKSAFDSVLGSPSSVNATTAGISSLNIGGSSASHMPIGPIGGANNSTAPMAPHSRTTSISNVNSLDEYGRSASGIGSSRSISRPAPGPIGPIGRRRDASQDELTSGGMTSSIFSSNPLPERILGSSALGGDDELVEPQPRRTSHNMAPMSNSSLFGSGAFGVASPWASSFATSSTSSGNGTNGSNVVPRTPSTPNPSLLHNALGTGLTSPTSLTGSTAPGGSSAFGSLHQSSSSMQPSMNSGVDPWARAANGWDRARFAFEQPSGQQQQQQQGGPTSSFQQQSQQPPVGASPLSPFGAPSQHTLRGMFGAPGQASQTSPHRPSNDRGL